MCDMCSRFLYLHPRKRQDGGSEAPRRKCWWKDLALPCWSGVRWLAGWLIYLVPLPHDSIQFNSLSAPLSRICRSTVTLHDPWNEMNSDDKMTMIMIMIMIMMIVMMMRIAYSKAPTRPSWFLLLLLLLLLLSQWSDAPSYLLYTSCVPLSIDCALGWERNRAATATLNRPMEVKVIHGGGCAHLGFDVARQGKARPGRSIFLVAEEMPPTRSGRFQMDRTQWMSCHDMTRRMVVVMMMAR